MKALQALGTLIAAAMLGIAPLPATVVTFDDLPGGQTGLVTIPDGYGGIRWAGSWSYYGYMFDPYNPASPPNRAIVDFLVHPTGTVEAVPLYFPTPVIFAGAYFAGYAGQFNLPGVSFQLFRNESLVGISDTLALNGTPTWLASGYSGLVDEVRIASANGYYVFDDVTYSAVIPEPAAWALMLTGFAMVGAAARWPRTSTRQQAQA